MKLLRTDGSAILESSTATSTRDLVREAREKGLSLSSADLRYAVLSNANLRSAVLSYANLSNADLSGVDLRSADLSYANLRSAVLSYANLRSAVLSSAVLSSADLSYAKIEDTVGLHWQHCPELGDFYGWKATANDSILCLRIPAEARRTNAIGSRKCRAEYCQIVAAYDKNRNRLKETTFNSKYNKDFVYSVGDLVHPDSYDPDPRVECSSGIHFFMTFAEAVEYSGVQVKVTIPSL